MEGAFTGATRTRRGSFEMGHGGTVFLDEIGEMPLHLQTKLLRVLQDKEVQPIGSEKPMSVDIRIMTATNRNLEELVSAKEFRQDLYYRLSVVSLVLPPLRERREDIPALVENYIDYFSTNLSRDIEGIAREALDAMVNYDWPGNVRELMNVVERTVLLAREETIKLEDLPVGISGYPVPVEVRAEAVNAGFVPEVLTGKTLKEVREEAVSHAETAYLTLLLGETRGRIGETARRAGILPRSLFEKMRRYGLKKEDFKDRSRTR
jgi:transcriptional regulator with GAF, ATPase, and Fis domain